MRALTLISRQNIDYWDNVYTPFYTNVFFKIAKRVHNRFNHITKGWIKLKEKILKKLEDEKLLPLYTATNLDYLDKAEEILLNNGLSFIEVTYRSDLASQAIKYLSESGKLIVGAGTVLNLETAKEAIENGAQFIVTPGFSEEVVKYCLDQDVLVFPGAVTPTEITKALDYGISNVKFFPANVYGGLQAIESLSGPFGGVKFLPTGGVDEKNVNNFLSNKAVLAVGGSFIISEKVIAEDDGKTANENLQKVIANLTK